MKYNKISIIGISGSGKTTLANELSRMLNLPVFHVDLLFCNERGEHASKNEFDKKHGELINLNKWIIEGYIEDSMVDRLHKSDLIIHLEYSRFVVLIRFVKRWIRNLFKKELIFPEVTFLGFLIKVFFETLVMRERKKIEIALKDVDLCKIIKIKSPNQLLIFINQQFHANKESVLNYT